MSVESSTKTGAFSEDALNEMSWAKQEPEWLRDLRIQSWREWERLPMPSRKDEEWRRTDLSMLDLAAVRPYSPVDGKVAELGALPGELRTMLGTDNAGDIRVQRNSLGAYARLSEQLASKGVVFEDLDTAIRENGDL